MKKVGCRGFNVTKHSNSIFIQIVILLDNAEMVDNAKDRLSLVNSFGESPLLDGRIRMNNLCIERSASLTGK